MSQANIIPQGNNQANTSFNAETCEAILDTAKTIYNEESERFKQAESKTNITIAFVGVLFGVYLTYIGAFKPSLDDVGYLIYTFIVKIGIFVCLTVSIIQFLRSIKTGKYDQVGLNNIVDIEFARTNVSQAKLELAQTYKDAVDANKDRIEEKMKYYNCGLNFLYWGFIVFSVHFVVEEVIRHVK